jgi:hypothetical protein
VVEQVVIDQHLQQLLLQVVQEDQVEEDQDQVIVLQLFQEEQEHQDKEIQEVKVNMLQDLGQVAEEVVEQEDQVMLHLNHHQQLLQEDLDQQIVLQEVQ